MQKEELYKTASLARLELSDEEAEKLSGAVSQMIEYFSLMEKIDVSDIPPTTHVSGGGNRVREDKIEESSLADVMIKAAPESEERFITIPNVL